MISSALERLSYLARSAVETEISRLASAFEKDLFQKVREEGSPELERAVATDSLLDEAGKNMEERSASASGLLNSLHKGGGGLNLPF